MLIEKQPLVTVGLPVYNGAAQIRVALDSMLAQDYENFEVVVLDNASMDNTEEIVREYTARDKRIQYFRNEVNVGAVGNFEKVAQLRSGKYFCWLAHDDCRAPSFLSKCVAKLEANPSVILCSVDVGVLDDKGELMTQFEGNVGFLGLETVGVNVVDKVADFVNRACCCVVYGVMRSEVFDAVGKFPAVFGWDYIFLVKLLLLGDFLRIPEKLIFYTFTQKNVGQYLDLLFTPQDRPQKAITGQAKMLIRVVLESPIAIEDKRRILDRFFDFIQNSHFWAVGITQENKGELDKELRKYFLKGLLVDLETFLP
ncbi:MAG: glycosyltransferase family 2 protein [Verrucomicrobiota bacterium]